MERDNRKVKIKIITTESFHVGMAASNRFISYAKGFAEHNCIVSVHCISPPQCYRKKYPSERETRFC